MIKINDISFKKKRFNDISPSIFINLGIQYVVRLEFQERKLETRH